MGIYRKIIGAAKEQLILPGVYGFPYAWLKDGRSILMVGGDTESFVQVSLSGNPNPVVLLKSDFPKDAPRLSPDERWIAYSSEESGRSEVYVATFPAFTQKQPVSSNGGCQPFWRKDGREIFYLSPDGNLMAAEIQTRSKERLTVRVPHALFEAPIKPNPILNQYAVSGDGKRFLFAAPVNQGPEQFTVILNWTAGLKK